MAFVQLPYLDNYFSVLDKLRALPYFILFDHTTLPGNSGPTMVASAMPTVWLSLDPAGSGSTFELRESLEYMFNKHFGIQELGELLNCSYTQSDHRGFQSGWAGYLSYEFGYQENYLEPAETEYPLAHIGLYLWTLQINPEKQQISVYFDTDCPPWLEIFIHQIIEGNLPEQQYFQLTTSFTTETSRQKYLADINRSKNYLTEGDCYQINYTQSFKGTYTGDPWLAYQKLRRHSPAPFSGFFDTGLVIISCHSPEQFLLISDQQITTKPIKGTRPRGRTQEQDLQLARELQDSEKDQAENLMIVDLLRNDLNKTALPGSVNVEQLFGLESYANVHHLVSTITARLDENQSPLSCFLAAFPGGSITGAPKKRAMEIIAELESRNRGPYCGSLFYLDRNNGELNSNIMIRTLVYGNGTVRAWGGGGIVIDSDGEMELQESITKIHNLIDLLETEFAVASDKADHRGDYL